MPRTPVYGPQPDSPPLPPETFGLTFAVRPALGQDGTPTLALFAAGLLPGRYAQVYGGRTQGAVEIVAIDACTGRVYHRRAERNDAVPLPLVMKPQPPPPDPEEAAIESIDAYFAVDLRAHLALPAEGAAYTVFLWLDEMTSGALRILVPGSQAETPPQPVVALPGFHFRRILGAPQAQGAEIVLQRAAGESRVYGAAGPALLGPLPEGTTDYLSVLGLDFRSRLLRGHRYPVPETARAARDLAFDFDLNFLFGGPGWLDSPDAPRRGFVVACLGESLSRVLVVEP
jgi:hypothetical protein